MTTGIDKSQITGVVLAGGRATRMGGVDKGLIEVGGVPMCLTVVEALRSQVQEVLINANRNIDAYRRFGHQVVQDEFPGYLGPLAGYASAMQAAATPWIVSAPCDCRLVTSDYVRRMSAFDPDRYDVVVARDGARMQPTFMLIRRDLLGDVKDFLESGERKIDRWFMRLRYLQADFSDVPKLFTNINTPEQRDKAQKSFVENGDGR